MKKADRLSTYHVRSSEVSASWKLLDIKNQLAFSIGIDIGDKKSRYCILDFQGEIVVEDLLATTEEEFSAYSFFDTKDMHCP